MIKVLPFKPEHVELAQITGGDVDEFLNCDFEIFKHPKNIAGTFVTDGRIVCFCGIGLRDDHTGEVWLIPSVYLKDHFLGTVKALKQYMVTFANEFKLKAMQTPGRDDRVVCRWLNWLGFDKRDNNIYVKDFNHGT